MDSTELRGPRNVTISPSKTSAGVQHKFKYNEQEVQTIEVYMDYLSFDKSITITDTTSVNFVGTISIGDTAQYNDDNPCPVENATVCILHVVTGESLECDQTNKNGMFRFPNNA